MCSVSKMPLWIGVWTAAIAVAGCTKTVVQPQQNAAQQEVVRPKNQARQPVQADRIAALPMPGVELQDMKELQDRSGQRGNNQYRVNVKNRNPQKVFGYQLDTEIFLTGEQRWKRILRKPSGRRDPLGEQFIVPFYINGHGDFDKIRVILHVFDAGGKEYTVEKTYASWTVIKEQ